MVRSMMEFAGLPISFWGYALESAYYILNRIPIKSIAKTPYEIWTGHKPTFSYLRIWGCPAYVMHLEIDKLGQRSDKCLFVGYPKESKGYYFYLPEKQESRMAILLSSMKTMRIQSPIWIQCKGLILSYGLEP